MSAVTEIYEVIGLFIHDGTERPSEIFDPSSNGLRNKWIALRTAFESHGIELATLDVLNGRQPDFELHADARPRLFAIPCFSVLIETHFVWPPNNNADLLDQYDWLFSWNPEWVEAGRATKIQLAHPLGQGKVDGYSERPLLVALVNANKSLPVWRPDADLYRERVRAIRWFEHHASGDFALYGPGWDKSPRLPTRIGGVVHRLEKILPWRPRWFPSWRGIAQSKYEVLRRARFSICYENVRGLRGYVTEKIFDAFCAGNVPIYWGAEDITDYIPSECFIDRRKFESYEELYEYLKAMPEERFIDYQNAICDFLASPSAERFSIRVFAETIVSKVLTKIRQII